MTIVEEKVSFLFVIKSLHYVIWGLKKVSKKPITFFVCASLGHNKRIYGGFL